MKESKTYLIEACRNGNRKAQLTLYTQHTQRLYAACFRIIGNASEAEEAVQDTFLKIFTHIKQHKDNACFEAWMQRIAIRTAIDYTRKQTPQWNELSEKDIVETDTEDACKEKIQCSVRLVKEGIGKLPSGYRIILSLYLFEGYDMEEIASILNIKLVSVHTQYSRAKKKLLELIPDIS